MADEFMEVVAAVIVDKDKILITQRMKGSFMGGRWEFPGGKVEKGEDHVEALVRELHEELRVNVRVLRPFFETEYCYWMGENRRTVHLSAYLCSIPEGKLTRVGVQDYKWVRHEELKDYDFVDADTGIVEKLSDK